jgi:hypothetical protein
MLVGAFLSNCIIALLVVARGFDAKWMMLGSLAPLPIGLLAFKMYCKSTFDRSLKYYTMGDRAKGVEAPTPIDKESRRRDRVAVRFGHPALYQKLTVPMVHESSKHLLAEVYRGRLDGDLGDTAAFSDVYTMKRMSKERPGKTASSATTPAAPFEFVSESKLDFENFKNRPEFSDEHGGEGSVYGGADHRPDTPGSQWGDSQRERSSSRDSERTDGEEGMQYPPGYHHTPSALREYSPSPGPLELRRLDSRESAYQVDDGARLVGGAAPMGSYSAYTPPSQREGGTDYFRR